MFVNGTYPPFECKICVIIRNVEFGIFIKIFFYDDLRIWIINYTPTPQS